MESMKLLGDALGYILAGLFILGAAMAKLGFLSIGKRNNGGCPDSKCRADVVTLVEKTSRHDEQISELFKITKKTSEDLAFIRGKLDAAKIIEFER